MNKKILFDWQQRMIFPFGRSVLGAEVDENLSLYEVNV